GFRIEPGEIENRLLLHKDIKEAVVIDLKDAGGGIFLCAYIVLRNSTESDTDSLSKSLAGFLMEKMPPFMVPAFFIPLDFIPLTTNGKVNRKALPEPDIASKNEYLQPVNEMEKILAGIWADVLNIDKEKIGRETHFFRSGGHSLKATAMISMMRDLLELEANLGDIFDHPTIRQLAEFLLQLKGHAGDNGLSDTANPVVPVEKKEYYPMAPAQKRIYFAQFMDERSTSYNVVQVYRALGSLDKDSLQKAFDTLIHRHESLRTSFRFVKDVPMQFIEEQATLEIQFQNCAENKTGETIDSVIEQFVRPFDFTRAPLMRVGVIEKSTTEFYLMMDVHHIVCDGQSYGTLLKEIEELCRGNELPSLSLTYKDYSNWYLNGTGKMDKEAEFWLNEFALPVPNIQLPYDFERPGKPDLSGDCIAFDIPAELTEDIRRFTADHDTTLFNVLLSAFYILMAKMGGVEDVVVGAPALGRDSADLMPIIGMFVNTLALRAFPEDGKTFSDFLNEVKAKSIAAFQNQDFQLEDLVDRLGIPRNANGNALFNVLFGVLNREGKSENLLDLSLPGVNLTTYDYKSKYSMMDFGIYAFEKEHHFQCMMEYNINLFEKHTIEIFGERYIVLLLE
ncbi:MAG: hypothetical protein GY765_36670, partial [bacterium]|nr:hypothetical protein [bacterium]